MKLRYALVLALMIAATAVRAEVVMEISTPKTHYVRHEPFWVVLTFRNTGTQDEKLVRDFDPCIDHVNYQITAPDGRQYKYESIYNCDRFAPDWGKVTVCLGPGEKFTAEADISFEMRLLDEKKRDFVFADTLSRPGEHRIRAKYRMPGPNPLTIESNECRFTVDEPQGIDRKVYDLLRAVRTYSPETIWIADTGARELERETWQKIVSEYLESAYAPNVMFNLAGEYAHGSLFKSDIPQREKQPGDAAQLFERCALRLGNSPLAVQAFSCAAFNYSQAGDAQGCRRMFEAELTCAGMTDERRLLALAFLYTEGRKPPVDNPEDVRLPLSVAEAMGFSVAWNAREKTVDVSNARTHFALKSDVTSIKDGRILVPLSVLAPLVADRYGRCNQPSKIDKPGQ